MEQLDNCRMDINRTFDIADTLRGCVPSVIKHHIVVCIHNIAEGNSEKYEFEGTEEEWNSFINELENTDRKVYKLFVVPDEERIVLTLLL